MSIFRVWEPVPQTGHPCLRVSGLTRMALIFNRGHGFLGTGLTFPTQRILKQVNRHVPASTPFSTQWLNAPRTSPSVPLGLSPESIHQ